MALIFVINGPNLNLLGSREPAHYGHDTLETIEQRLTDMATGFGHQLEFIQHNHEGVLIDLIRQTRSRLHHHQPRRLYPHQRCPA